MELTLAQSRRQLKLKSETVRVFLPQARILFLGFD